MRSLISYQSIGRGTQASVMMKRLDRGWTKTALQNFKPKDNSLNSLKISMLGARVELARPCGQGILSLQCLPFHHPSDKIKKPERLPQRLGILSQQSNNIQYEKSLNFTQL